MARGMTNEVEPPGGQADRVIESSRRRRKDELGRACQLVSTALSVLKSENPRGINIALIPWHSTTSGGIHHESPAAATHVRMQVVNVRSARAVQT